MASRVSDVPYDELDPPIRALVSVLNELPGVYTIGSCSGHAEPVSPMSCPADEWYVVFRLEPADPDADVAVPTAQAWLDLEFLAYHVEALYGRRDVTLFPFALPPHLNEPGRMLQFQIGGSRGGESGVDPDELASSIRQDMDELYVPLE